MQRRLTAPEREQVLAVLEVLAKLLDGTSPKNLGRARAIRDSIVMSGVRDQSWLDRNFRDEAVTP
jgi:hypothetical protein